MPPTRKEIQRANTRDYRRANQAFEKLTPAKQATELAATAGCCDGSYKFVNKGSHTRTTAGGTDTER